MRIAEVAPARDYTLQALCKKDLREGRGGGRGAARRLSLSVYSWPARHALWGVFGSECGMQEDGERGP